MTTAEFVRGLIRLTAQGEAQWRIGRTRRNVPSRRAFLPLGEWTFVLTLIDGTTPTLIEQGTTKRLPTVLHAPPEVQQLAHFVREWLGRKVPAALVLGRDDEVEEGWRAIMARAERVKTIEESHVAETEIWHRPTNGGKR